MNIKILSIGKLRVDYLRQGEAEYLKRLTGSPFKVEHLEIDLGRTGNMNAETVKQREAEKALTYVNSGDLLVVLDEHGKQWGSVELADWLQEQRLRGTRSVIMAIGGASGWHESIFRRADVRWSLSKLTFPHQMIRLILAEQIFRAHSILEGSPYHRE